ncbi:hypothetical protein EV644_104284 [Kribbella orskensis]|uniref:BNR repeat neuraminidase n=1 Tax=Kribbella orskensis TaxID=2512216 RepID=A0ABY2BMZ0_9ACTN|nr:MULTISPECIES: hypothetical protein [Kribbella]TCN41902.1 hypothetical protein EV642_103284 [Kribbella sp. VKM Ac-2500]TCO25780.1 hypothetical protein EV644_104284 [Kribbella orskensis]
MKKLFAIGAAASSLLFSATIATPAQAAVATPTWLTANSVATGDQDVPSIATNRNGYVAVVWEDDRDTTAATDNAHSDIFVRLFRNGTAVYEKKLSAGGSSGVTNWRHLQPDVGLDDKGNAVVVWADDPDGNGYYNVPYRVVNTAGTVTASGNANNSSTGQQINPRVAVDPDGAPAGGAVAFSVVWEDIQTGAQPLIKAAGFTGPTTRAWQVTASQTTGQHHKPDVAVSASGDAIVVWDEDGDANAWYNIGLLGLARTNGAVTLSRRTANSNGGGQQTHASVAANFNGDFAVAWESDHTGTAGAWTRTFDGAGTPRFADVQVAAGGKDPDVGIDDQSNSVVGWTIQATDLDVWVRGFGTDGTDTGRLSAQQLSQVTVGRQEQLAVAVSPWSEVAVAYTDDNDGNTFDQVILGLDISNNSW